MLAHWDDVEAVRRELGHLASSWRLLGDAAGSRTVGLNRVEIDPGKWSTPVHRQTGEEEIFFVLGGSGICLLDEKAAAEVRPGDCIVHRFGAETHSLRAGPEGLDVLVFGTRVETEAGHLPRAGIAWLGGTWADVGATPHPWEREVAAGEPDCPEPGARPANIVNVDEAPSLDEGRSRRLGEAAGAQLTGLNQVSLRPGESGAPPHCHSAEEELFVVLDGDGAIELLPSPVKAARGAEAENHELRRGHVVSRPPGTGIAHSFRAGDRGLTILAYGTREPNDIAYYPRSNKVYFRGVGFIGRLEPLDYWEGER